MCIPRLPIPSNIDPVFVVTVSLISCDTERTKIVKRNGAGNKGNDEEGVRDNDCKTGREVDDEIVRN